MRNLRLVGITDDGRHVVVADESGHEFAMPADDQLRAALRGDRARIGQLEIEMHSALRPRDIQARIRAGHSPDEVAALAQVDVDRIMAYAYPVLAEREYKAQQATRSHVRRRNVDGPAVKLGEVVAERLRSRDLDPELTTWDAWRRDDGTWIVQARYRSGEQEHHAEFVYDTAGKFSVAADDEAKWLTGEKQSTRRGPQPRAKGGRRLSAVQDIDDLLTLADDDLTEVARAVSDEPEELEADTAETAADPRQLQVPMPGEEGPTAEGDSADADASLGHHDAQEGNDDRSAPGGLSIMADREVTVTEARQRRRRRNRRQTDTPEPTVADTPGPAEPDADTGDVPAVETPAAETPEAAKPEAPRQRRKPKPKRASVPSWDEIMLGGSSTSGDDD